MTQPIDRVEPMIQETLSRVALLGLSDRQVENAAGIPSSFLVKARKGKGRHSSAASSWAKLTRWLATQGVVGKGAATVSAPESATRDATGQAANDLAALVREAETASALKEAGKALIVAVIKCDVDAKTAGVVNDLLKEQRQILRLAFIEQAQEKLGELEIMTEDEAEEFDAWRASRAPRALAPGEAPQAPTVGTKETR